VQPVFIAEGQMIQQVFDGLYAALGKVLGDALAHPLHILHLRG